MAKIAFILLCHKDPPAIIRQAQRLTATGDYVSIHFDARSRPADYAAITEALASNPGVSFARRRIKCGWGAWSLVQATLNALEVAEESFPDATHFYMLSGDCLPVKSAAYAHRFLDDRDRDYVESFDFMTSDWIKTGFKEERLIYRHWFNERTQKWLFYRSFELQRWLRPQASRPGRHRRVQIGSQWWCRAAARSRRSSILRRTPRTWCVFAQRPGIREYRTRRSSLDSRAVHLVREREIEKPQADLQRCSATYGSPRQLLTNDQYGPALSRRTTCIARKISAEADAAQGTARDAVWRRNKTDYWSRHPARGREAATPFLTGRWWRIGKRYWHAGFSSGNAARPSTGEGRRRRVGPDRKPLYMPLVCTEKMACRQAGCFYAASTAGLCAASNTCSTEEGLPGARIWAGSSGRWKSATDHSRAADADAVRLSTIRTG